MFSFLPFLYAITIYASTFMRKSLDLVLINNNVYVKLIVYK